MKSTRNSPGDRANLEIREAVEDRRIRALYHFTPIDNLSSIVERGLQSVMQIEGTVEFVRNDPTRADRQLNHISLSISAPNLGLLRTYELRFPQRGYAILELPASILWRRRCQFKWTNAAAAICSQDPPDEYRGLSAFDYIFDDRVPGPHGPVFRTDGHKACEPTDPQAEVLVEGWIAPKSIRKVHFRRASQLVDFVNRHPDFGKPMQLSPHLFGGASQHGSQVFLSK